VDSAYQGQEGVWLVKKALEAGRPYAVVFVDVRMPPGWDGVETTRKSWELDPDLQVVFCTAYSDYSWGELFEKLGPSDGLLILKKPFDGEEAFQLAHALTEKWWLHQQSRRKMEELESRVAERTAELAKTNAALQTENTERKRMEEQIQQQLGELRRWQAVMLGREDRNMKLKREVNELSHHLGEPIRYPSHHRAPASPRAGAGGPGRNAKAAGVVRPIPPDAAQRGGRRERSGGGAGPPSPHCRPLPHGSRRRDVQ